MEQKRLSIVIPTFNSAATISEALNSVAKQKVSGMECIVVDGKSTDRTVGILVEYARTYPFLRFISEPDSGIYDAMNKGIALAEGDYLFFLGSDDKLYDENVLNKIFAEPSFGKTDFIYGDVIFKHNRARVGEEKNYLKLMRNQENICHQSIFYSRRVFEKLGKYDLTYPIFADFHLNIRCFRDRELTKQYINSIICIFNEKGTSHYFRNSDPFLVEVHEEYVRNHLDPVATFDTARQLETRIVELMNSKDYLLGKKIGDGMRRMKGIVARIKSAIF